MTITLERTHAGSSQAPQLDTPRTTPRTGLLALLGEAIAAARAVRTADPRTQVAVAARFAERISA